MADIKPGDVVRVSFTAPVVRVGDPGAGLPLWVLVNGYWFKWDQYEVVEGS